MRVLLIGSTSVLGAAVAERLQQNEHDVEVSGRRSRLSLDVRDEKLPEWVQHERFDAVVNLAGCVAADDASAVRDMVLVNSLGPVTAARVAEATGADRLVHVSSWYAGRPADYRAHPLYPLTKHHGEELLTVHAADSALSVVVLRPSHVYDDAGRCRQHQAALYWLVDEALAGREAAVPEPELVRDYLHIDDFTAAVLAALGPGVSGVFPVLSPAARRFGELATAASNAVADPDGPARAGGPAGAGGGVDEHTDTLPGFAAAVGVEEGLRRIVRAAQT